MSTYVHVCVTPFSEEDSHIGSVAITNAKSRYLFPRLTQVQVADVFLGHFNEFVLLLLTPVPYMRCRCFLSPTDLWMGYISASHAPQFKRVFAYVPSCARTCLYVSHNVRVCGWVGRVDKVVPPTTGGSLPL